MNRVFTRAATLALALPFATGVLAANAHAAEPVGATVPGCYGALFDWAIVCDLTLVVETPEPEFKPMYVKVCAGACHDVPIPTVGIAPGTAARLCYSFTDGGGYANTGCVSDFTDSAVDTGFLVDLFACSASQLLCVHE